MSRPTPSWFRRQTHRPVPRPITSCFRGSLLPPGKYKACAPPEGEKCLINGRMRLIYGVDTATSWGGDGGQAVAVTDALPKNKERAAAFHTLLGKFPKNAWFSSISKKDTLPTRIHHTRKNSATGAIELGVTIWSKKAELTRLYGCEGRGYRNLEPPFSKNFTLLCI